MENANSIYYFFEWRKKASVNTQFRHNDVFILNVLSFSIGLKVHLRDTVERA